MHLQADRNRARPTRLHYDTGEKREKWTRNDLVGIAACVIVLFGIWAFSEIRGCAADGSRLDLSRTRTQLAEARKKNDALTQQLADTRKQLEEATDRVFALTAVAGRAPALPVRIKSWHDTSTTESVALENQSNQDLSVHVAVTSPNRDHPREQDCYIPAHKTVGTPFRVYPRDVVIVTADGFATRTQHME